MSGPNRTWDVPLLMQEKTPSSKPSPIKALRSGSLFANRYIVEAKLGAGGMGAVYRVRDTFLGETIALKLAAVTRDDGERARAAWEIQRSEVALARRVTHPHVARVFDLGRYDGIPFITMAYVPGRPLSAALQVSELGHSDALRLAYHVASALHAAHAASVLHLDLKPGNIVLTEEASFNAVLVDFGIARALGERGLGFGTGDYVAPELLENQPLSGAADVFALGCVLYVALTQGPAFPGSNLQQRMNARMTGPPRSLPKAVPRELATLIHSCLERAPGDRPTAAELELAFGELLHKVEPAGVPEGPAAGYGRAASPAIDLGGFAGGLGRRLAAARHKLLRVGREREALEDIDGIVAAEPELPVALALRALALVRLWNLSHSQSADARNALADRAVQAVSEARARAPRLADTHLADALIAEYAGDICYAVRALKRAQMYEPLHAYSHEVLGRIELEAGLGGVDRLLLAYELDPRQFGALSVVAREYFMTGRDQEAEALLHKLEALEDAPVLEALAVRLRRSIWRRDAHEAKRLLSVAPVTSSIGMRFLLDCASALTGKFSAAQFIERAADTVAQSTSSKRRSFVHQLAAEGLVALSADHALRHVVSAARLSLVDIRWLDACPALAPLRELPAFRDARAAVKERLDRALTSPGAGEPMWWMHDEGGSDGGRNSLTAPVARSGVSSVFKSRPPTIPFNSSTTTRRR